MARCRYFTHGGKHPGEVFRACDSPVHRNCWLRECCVHVVDWYGIVWVGGVAAHINDDRQATRCSRGNLFPSEERRNGRRKIDAVDEDVNIKDLLEWSALCCLSQIPFEDIVPTASRISMSTLQIGEWTHSSRPIFLKRSTAPRPQRPSAPITRALTPLPLPPKLSLTAATMAPSFAYGVRWPSSFPALIEASARAPAAAPANPAWYPNAATLRPVASVRNSRSYRVPLPL